MKRSHRFSFLVAFIAAAFFSVSCQKDAPVDLSQRGGNWKVTQCNEPVSDGVVAVPDEKGIFVVGDRIEYSANSNGSDRLVLFRTIQVKGESILYEGIFKGTVSGDELTLLEEVYGGPHMLRFTYTIQKLTETEFVLKRTDLGKNEGIVTMKRE